jgi:hypothetical protein
LIKRHSSAPSISYFEFCFQLRVDDISIRGLTWSKLLDPDKKGQWWLSGDLVSATDNIENIEDVANKIDKDVAETQRMLQLAAAQRMNTDSRRAIFCIIMSGEDYIDAFEKLLRLELPGKQVSNFFLPFLMSFSTYETFRLVIYFSLMYFRTEI